MSEKKISTAEMIFRAMVENGKRAEKRLEWNVVTYDHNKDCFRSYNVLSDGLVDEIKKETKKAVGRAAFADGVKRVCMYHFWSRFEWEIVLTEWTGRDNPNQLKVDVYDQLKLNWDRFIDYLWANLWKGESDERSN